MKLKSMTSVITKSALVLAAAASLNAFAGTPAPAKGVTPVVEEDAGALFDTLGATVEVGYDTRLYYRGLWFADNVTWAGLSLSVPLTEQLSLGFGALYVSTVDTLVNDEGADTLDYSELDLSTSLTYDAGFAKFGLVYTHYEFFDGFGGTTANGPFGAGEGNVSSADEVGITVSTTAGPLNIYTGFYYDFRIGGSYAEVGFDLPIEITSWLSIVPAVKGGYGFDYYTSGVVPGVQSSGFTHVIPSISAPIKLTKIATLTPYIAYNLSLDARHELNTTDSEIFGGVKLSVSF
ncbi:hypothetical protein SAMN02745166_04276 [Prosthecobacter debontii]|uniref:MetA-pathway of phenol degradation n=1 Tax=Prosthecobacter debontii TaxID=48467 RepID=A0A1T4YV48_9BACT|nr:hypothetical protein [Prosthecobacter debontii]SKB05458.1 hypothetical protein SAMN02745166_04276 [Prosthecobacter debontii]